jgi:hypothetical protein
MTLVLNGGGMCESKVSQCRGDALPEERKSGYNGTPLDSEDSVRTGSKQFGIGAMRGRKCVKLPRYGEMP